MSDSFLITTLDRFNMKIKSALAISFLLLLSVLSFAQTSKNEFDIRIRLYLEGADSTGGTIKITRHGFHVKTIESKGINHHVGLKFNSYYLITCSKEGYTTKVVYFDTHIPKGRSSREFAKFRVTVNLFKAPKGERIKRPKPIGGCAFDPEIDDFDKVKK